MRRRVVVAAACAVALVAVAGCGGDGNGEADNGAVDNGAVTSPAPEGEADGADGGNGERHPSVPAALTTEELCTDFEADVIDPTTAEMGSALDAAIDAFEAGDQAGFEDGMATYREIMAEYEQILRDAATAVTDNPDVAAALDTFADALHEFEEVFYEFVTGPEFDPDGAPSDELLALGEEMEVTRDQVRAHCD